MTCSFDCPQKLALFLSCFAQSQRRGLQSGGSFILASQYTGGDIRPLKAIPIPALAEAFGNLVVVKATPDSPLDVILQASTNAVSLTLSGCGIPVAQSSSCPLVVPLPVGWGLFPCPLPVLSQ